MSEVTTLPPLISATELAPLLGSTHVKVFDVRGSWGSSAADNQVQYDQAHIPGAVFLDWTTHFITTGLPVGLAPVASKEAAKRSFEALGINPNDTVVLYDDYHHMMAGRIWWAMRYWGFTQVKVLNGGWQYWQKRGFDVSSSNSKCSSGSFEPVQNPSLIISLDTLINTKNDLHLVDSRGPINYRGNDEDERSGHIPGAINIPFKAVLNEDTGLFKTTDELNALFDEQLSDVKNTPIVTSCGSGYAGTVTLLALATIGIYAALFDGSFAVWKANKNLPVSRES